MRNFLIATLLMATTVLPATAQNAMNSTAATGGFGWDNGPTQGSFYGPARDTGNQRIGLPQASSSSPMAGGGNAPGNLALMQMGKKSLPPTKLTGFVLRGGDAVFGDEGTTREPPFNNFTMGNRIEQSMQQMPDLTTKHRIGGPSAWDFPE